MLEVRVTATLPFGYCNSGCFCAADGRRVDYLGSPARKAARTGGGSLQPVLRVRALVCPSFSESIDDSNSFFASFHCPRFVSAHCSYAPRACYSAVSIVRSGTQSGRRRHVRRIATCCKSIRTWSVADVEVVCCSIVCRQFLDATSKGNVARFVNNSCEPNCEVQKWCALLGWLSSIADSGIVVRSVAGEYRLAIVARAAVAAGSEITIDYGSAHFCCRLCPQPHLFVSTHFGGEQQQPCRCGSAKCTGVIGKPVCLLAVCLPPATDFCIRALRGVRRLPAKPRDQLVRRSPPSVANVLRSVQPQWANPSPLGDLPLLLLLPLLPAR